MAEITISMAQPAIDASLEALILCFSEDTRDHTSREFSADEKESMEGEICGAKIARAALWTVVQNVPLQHLTLLKQEVKNFLAGVGIYRFDPSVDDLIMKTYKAAQHQVPHVRLPPLHYVLRHSHRLIDEKIEEFRSKMID